MEIESIGQDEIGRENIRPAAAEERREPWSAPLLRGGREGRTSKGDWKRTPSKVERKPGSQEVGCHRSLEYEVFQK